MTVYVEVEQPAEEVKTFRKCCERVIVTDDRERAVLRMQAFSAAGRFAWIKPNDELDARFYKLLGDYAGFMDERVR